MAKRTLLKHIPWILIYSRIVFAFLIAFLAFSSLPNAPYWIVGLMVAGLVSDIFDGIIARKLGVSSEKLRVWDSNVDQFFWLLSIASIFYMSFDFVWAQAFWIGMVFVLELLCYLSSLLKFRKPIATHSLLAKLWTLTMLAFLIDLTIHGSSYIPFTITITLGIVSRLEIVLIVLGLKNWTTDVPSILAVRNINQGKPVKRHKLFNG